MPHITRQRNRDFIRQCEKSAKILRNQGARPTVDEIVSHALKQAAPSYYADYYRATSILRHKPDHRRHKKKLYASSRQWVDMAADLAKIRLKNPRKSPREIILDLCTGRAGSPRFYMTHRRALEIAAPLLTPNS